jgi:hypothetical protein
MNRLRIVSFALLLSIAPLVFSQSMELEPVADRDFTFVPLEGAGFGFDFLALFGGTIKPNFSMYKQLLGDTYTIGTAVLSVTPYANGYWPYDADGNFLAGGSHLTDPNSLYKQLANSLSFTLYQGLHSDFSQGIPSLINQLYLYTGYTAYFNYYYQDSSPDTYLFNSNQPDKDGWFGNVLKIGIAYNDVLHNRLINVKSGFFGQVQFEWAPRELFNDIYGLSDFTRLTAVVNSNIPLVQDKDFSMYLYHHTGFDITSGNYVPVAYLFNMAHNTIRGGLLLNAPMHFSNTIELRGSFPSLFEPGMMPGFVLVWDYGLYSTTDYQFNFDQYASSLGAAFVVHLDLSSLVPNMTGAILDMQLGTVYDVGQKQFKFHFNMTLPQLY